MWYWTLGYYLIGLILAYTIVETFDDGGLLGTFERDPENFIFLTIFAPWFWPIVTVIFLVIGLAVTVGSFIKKHWVN